MSGKFMNKKFRFKKDDWDRLTEEFDNRCVRCGLGGFHLDRDHIIPWYKSENGSISNIQPLCSWCNSSKGSEDLNWKEYRRKNGWGIQNKLNLPPSHPFKVKIIKENNNGET